MPFCFIQEEKIDLNALKEEPCETKLVVEYCWIHITQRWAFVPCLIALTLSTWATACI
jgi:hypothetical protein